MISEYSVLDQLVNSDQQRILTSRGVLLRAFNHFIELKGRRQVTDLHVRRLLCYVRAHDRYYSGVPRSLAQLAKQLTLSVATCRRVIARAVEEFGLLIVIPQHDYFGGQTINRYTINWDEVDALLRDADRDIVCEPETPNPPHNTLPGNADMPVRLALLVGSSSRVVIFSASAARTRPSRHRMSSFPLASCPTVSAPPQTILSDSVDLDSLRSSSSSAVKSVTPHSSHTTYSDPTTTPYLLIRSGGLPPVRCQRPTPDSGTTANCPNDKRAKTVGRPIALPRGTPVELLAHFDILLAKLQTAIDRAKRFGATKICDRLNTLRSKLAAVHFRARHAAMCRTNLPPLNPPPPRPPVDFRESTARFFEHAARNPIKYRPLVPIKYEPNPDLPDRTPEEWLQVAYANAAALSDHPPAAAAHASSPDQLESSDDPALQFESLLIALDDLLTSVNSALVCARSHKSNWLKHRFTTLRRRTKAIQRAAHAVSGSLLAQPQSPQSSRTSATTDEPTPTHPSTNAPLPPDTPLAPSTPPRSSHHPHPRHA
jgi:hypothetical protein